jgi:photosystem II stability/assembly factor-like uncharacterized protein
MIDVMKFLILLAFALVSASAFAAPVGDALDRPALVVRAPQRAVLLAGAMAGDRIVAVGERGIVALSDDGGRSWRQAEVPTSVTLTAVRFVDASRGWAVGHGGIVLATEDGGQHWIRQLDGRGAAQIVLEAAKRAGDAKAAAEAERLVADGPDKPMLDLLIHGDRSLLVVGAYGLALASDDGGRTWTSWAPRLPNPRGLHIYAVRRLGDTLLLAGEQGLVMLSNDGGSSFRRIETPYKGTYFTAELLDSQGIVLAGLRGNVLQSVDGGTTWASLPSPMPVSITSSMLDRDGRFLAGNQAGFVLQLRDGRMVPLNANPLPPLNGLQAAGSNGLLGLGIQGVSFVQVSSGAVK